MVLKRGGGREKGPGTGLHIRVVVKLQGQVQETTLLPLQVSVETARLDLSLEHLSQVDLSV